MTYTAPLDEMLFVLTNLCDLDGLSKLPGLEDATPEMVAAILEEAAKFASGVLAPLNVIGDREGARCTKGVVTSPAGWKTAYDQLVEMGWNSPAAAADHGGMGLPAVVNACIQEMFQGANMAFQLCPMLTQGAIEAIDLYGSGAMKQTYLPRLISGEWTGTMNLTEPQAGSDLAAIRSKALPEGNHFRISGQKIFITYGDHDLTDNIIHLVLARLPNAPDGVKGISLFVVPKFLVNDDGSLGARNDIRCVSIEEKLGIHGSPTCTLSFGDTSGAVGYLVGAPHKGLQYMFSMMNNARLNVGIQGIGVAERATQQAVAYAMDRRQGRTPEGADPAIIGHPDIRRMLGLMTCRTQAARALAYRAAASLDIAQRADNDALRAYHQRRVDLLIPIVKGWATELAVSTASLGVQVHGGMGYIEETGAAQHLRDARITTIYEGTTGIQALDLVGRKIARDGGQAVGELVSEMRRTARALAVADTAMADPSTVVAAVDQAADAMERTTALVLSRDSEVQATAASTVLELFGIALGCWCMGDTVLKLKRENSEQSSDFEQAKVALARFYIANDFPRVTALEQILVHGGPDILNLNSAHFGAV